MPYSSADLLYQNTHFEYTAPSYSMPSSTGSYVVVPNPHQPGASYLGSTASPSIAMSASNLTQPLETSTYTRHNTYLPDSDASHQQQQEENTAYARQNMNMHEEDYSQLDRYSSHRVLPPESFETSSTIFVLENTTTDTHMNYATSTINQSGDQQLGQILYTSFDEGMINTHHLYNSPDMDNYTTDYYATLDDTGPGASHDMWIEGQHKKDLLGMGAQFEK
ncbi:hypothetical protein F5884DRAFT_770167 [Xylogone sp. PMI_703]|nr:hypothetical protein F5884DRAFT_770167 [Xylogone sp. PMI_703]